MQEEHPHEIRHFKDGDEIPAGFRKLTPEQFDKVDTMTADERAAWVAKQARRAGGPTKARLRDAFGKQHFK